MSARISCILASTSGLGYRICGTPVSDHEGTVIDEFRARPRLDGRASPARRWRCGRMPSDGWWIVVGPTGRGPRACSRTSRSAVSCPAESAASTTVRRRRLDRARLRRAGAMRARPPARVRALLIPRLSEPQAAVRRVSDAGRGSTSVGGPRRRAGDLAAVAAGDTRLRSQTTLAVYTHATGQAREMALAAVGAYLDQLLAAAPRLRSALAS